MSSVLILVIILVIVVLGFLIAFFMLSRKIADLTGSQKSDQSLLMLQNQINEITKTLDNKLGQSTEVLQRQFSDNLSIVRSVAQELTSLRETNRQVLGVQDQIQKLEKVLTSQKLRGNLGEAGLQLVLENILPPTAYKMQYKFDDGDQVDAAIFTKDGIIPVDAKFSLENYNRIIDEVNEDRRLKLENEFKKDLQKRIDETSKYIKPGLGTLDFAFMFIPAEAIFYDLLVNEIGAVKINTRNLIDYAFKERRVIIVSPTTFAAYLQTVLQGLNALKLEQQTKEIIKRVEMLGRHMNSYGVFLDKLGNSITTSVNMYNTAAKEFKKIDKDVVKISGGSSTFDPLQLDKPSNDK
ncbi:MAG: DNA recombination protein RmuC [Candidatus Buchananbacteria bacterium]|nr:DNA recombination protein RmuC [Candidatus Buchananbacteria bacterium]